MVAVVGEGGGAWWGGEGLHLPPLLAECDPESRLAAVTPTAPPTPFLPPNPPTLAPHPLPER